MEEKPETQENYHRDHLPVHDAVALIVARMASHPSEFYNLSGARPTSVPGVAMLRYAEQTKAVWNQRERKLFNEALREVRMQELHEALMKQLLAK
jgi:hypothetical protein